MLGLKSTSKQVWIDNAARNFESILIDHAHCEKKAAATGWALISRYPDRKRLVRELIHHIEEETEHFAMIYGEMEKRDITLTKDPGNPYAKALHGLVRKQEPHRMMDLLLTAALIEARSCERFSCLVQHEAVPEDVLQLYKDLLASEAGHYRTFTDIAREYFPADEVKARWEELATAEAEIVANLPGNPTMHG